MKIVLFQPEIPQNTGNIIRTCSVTQTELTLIKPLGFQFSNRQLKRAGLDYHKDVTITLEDDFFSFLEKNPHIPFYFLSSKATKNYTDVTFEANTMFIFGSETRGLPIEFFSRWPEKFLKIPMSHHARCLNLSNAVAIVLYEALRQQRFAFSTSF